MNTDDLTIGFDAKRAMNNMTGLGNYSRLVIEVMADTLRDSRLLLYAPRDSHNPRLEPIVTSHDNVKVVTPDSSLPGALWRTWGITRQLRRDGVMLYHGLSNELPLNIRRSGIPSVVTIHDVIYRRLPRCYKAVDRAIYDYKYGRSARNADRVIAISERTRDDIIEYYGVDPSRIDVVYQACDPQFAVPVDDKRVREVLERYGLASRPYVIGVGTVEERKNQLLTLKALRTLPDDVALVLVGRRTPYADLLDSYAASHRLTDRLLWLTDVPFADLPALYRGAVAASYPSRYEGFGLPVTEALSAGTPIVVATGSCLEEAAGPDAPAVNPDDPEAMAHALNNIIHDSQYARRLIEQGQAHIARFSPQAFAQGILDTYKKTLHA